MNLKKILDEQRKLIRLDDKTLNELNKKTKELVGNLKKKINYAEVFIGGSFAKNTLIDKEKIEVDIFVRFDWKIEDISTVLENAVKKTSKELNLKMVKIHGSRDYFKLINGTDFEIIPVYKIKKPNEARNVTDLSYFHVNYVKNKIKRGNLALEVMLAKKFCRAQGVYGAEDYIKGFSGYGLECLIIHYGSFEKMIKEIIKVSDRIIIDPEKHYRKKENALFEMNESKLHSPIVLVDPTWKERNILAALSWESLKKFQNAVLKFLKSPSLKFFEDRKLDVMSLRKLSGEFTHLKLKTDKQEGDIAGTKMKKFSKFLEFELRKYFNIVKSEFIYSGRQEADFYLVVKPKKEFIKLGPPVSMKENADAFKKINKNVFEKDGYLYARIKVDFSAKEFLEKFVKEQKNKVKEMGIVDIEIFDK